MAVKDPLNVQLSDNEVLTAFQRALNDYTNANIDSLLSSLNQNLRSLINQKVSAVDGYGLISDSDLEKLDNLENYDDSDIRNILQTKVDKITGSSLVNDDLIFLLTQVFGDTNIDVPDRIKIPEQSDLNTYTTPGVYKCVSQAIASTCTNVPINQAFRMDVKSILSSDRSIQILYPNNVPEMHFYIRNMRASGWTDWQKISGTELMNAFTIQEVIPEQSDLDLYFNDVIGDNNYHIYFCYSNAVAASIQNKPPDWVSGTFALEVYKCGLNQSIQRLTHTLYNGSASNIYIRSKVHSATTERISNWFKIAMVEIPPAENSINNQPASLTSFNNSESE